MNQSFSDPKLLVFFLGSFLEQKQALGSNLYTESELTEAWGGITKMPLGIDQSKVKGFQVHSSLLKQPALSAEIVTELFKLYQNSQTNLISEVLRHKNCPALEVEKYFKLGLQTENWTAVVWALHSENLGLKVKLVEALTNDGAKVERLKFHLHNNFATNPMQEIISVCLQNSPSKRFIQEMYFHLQQNHQASLQTISDVLLNRQATGLKVLKNIWSQSKRLPPPLQGALLTHPQVDDKLLGEMLKTLILAVPREVALFNAVLWVLKNRVVPAEVLQTLYLQALPHLEMLTLILQHPTMNLDWVWWTLQDPASQQLPPLNRALLKTSLKI
jgi:hypothetical protein